MAVGKEIKNKIGSVAEHAKDHQRHADGGGQQNAAHPGQDGVRGNPTVKRIRGVIGHLANANPEYKPHLYDTSVTSKRIGYIVIATDRGLCGGLNVNLFRAKLSKIDGGVGCQRCAVRTWGLIGNKAAPFFRSVGANIKAVMNDVGETPALTDLIGGIKVMLDAYESGEIDQVCIWPATTSSTP